MSIFFNGKMINCREHFACHQLNNLDPNQMEQVTGTTYSSFAVIGSLICVLGGVLNGFTLATFIKHRSLLTVQNIILFSMCFSDFLTSWFANPFTIHANLKEEWPFGESGCKAYGFLITLCGLASINHLAGAAFERYDTLDRAASGQGLFNKKRVIYFVYFSLVLFAGFQRCSISRLVFIHGTLKVLVQVVL